MLRKIWLVDKKQHWEYIWMLALRFALSPRLPSWHLFHTILEVTTEYFCVVAVICLPCGKFIIWESLSRFLKSYNHVRWSFPNIIKSLLIATIASASFDAFGQCVAVGVLRAVFPSLPDASSLLANLACILRHYFMTWCIFCYLFPW